MSIPEEHRGQKDPDINDPSKTWFHKSPMIYNKKWVFDKRKYKKNPIASYGIILYTIENDKIYFLLSQRRDTIEYIEYLRGRYTLQNLHLFLSLMTSTERQRLLTYSFDDLWNDLWINKSHKLYSEEYLKAKNKFNSLLEHLPTLIETTRSFLTEPPWGFPKGKKNENETDFDCALREFVEETKIELKDYTLIKETPFNEIYLGSDKKLYSTHYFICEVSSRIPIVKMSNLDGIRKESVSEEIADLVWLSLDRACFNLNYKKQNLLRSVHKYICKKKRRPYGF